MSHPARRSPRARRRDVRRSVPPGYTPRRTVLGFETLEDRCLLAVFTVDNLNDAGPGSLRDAIAQANAAAGHDEIVFAGEATSGVIGLTSGELSVTDSLTITGPGRDDVAIESQSLARIFNFTAIGGAESTEDFALSGLTLRNGLTTVTNSLDGGGAVRFFSSGQLAVNDSRFESNAVVSTLPSGDEGGGGAIFSATGSVAVRNSTFENNSASGSRAATMGGAIFVVSGAIDVDQSILRENEAGGYGGAIATIAGPLSITDSTLTRNDASRGGGIATSVGSISLLRCEISNNEAGQGGAGVQAAEIENAYNVPATGWGHVVIESCVLANNRGLIGGVYAESRNVTVRSTTLSGNQGVHGVGGIGWYDTAGFQFLLEDSDAIANVGGWAYGGALDLRGDAVATHSVISQNTIGDPGMMYGGGLYHEGGNLTISDSEITDNYFTLGQGQIHAGAGIALDGSNAEIVRSVIRGNRIERAFGQGLHYGAGIYLVRTGPGSLTIRDSEISDNHISDQAGGDAQGGGLYSSAGWQTRVFSSAIHGNSANSVNVNRAKGGGIAGERVTLVSSTVANNSTNGAGGGIAPIVFDLLPVNSTADVLLLSSTVAGNRADYRGGGVAMEVEGRLKMTGSIVAGNTAGAAPDVAIDSAVTLEIDFSFVGDTTGSGITAATGVGNILNQDPRLGPLADNGGPTPTMALLPNSPGINTSPIPLDTDLYDYRLDDSLSDANASGPDIAAFGGELLGNAYRFGFNEGLKMQIHESEVDDYTLELWFKLDDISTASGYQKLVDFSTPTHPHAGLYVYNNLLRYHVTDGIGFFTGGKELDSDVWHQVVLTRKGGPEAEFRVYLDGDLDRGFAESYDGHTLGVITEPGDTANTRGVRLFRSIGDGFGANEGGAVDRVRFYDDPLDTDEVHQAYAEVHWASIAALLGDFDQRGEPFARLSGGAVDMGAYEAQATLTAAPGDYNRDGMVGAADYTMWRDNVGTSITKLTGADGDGNGMIDDVDYQVWKSHFGFDHSLPSTLETVSVVRPLVVASAPTEVTTPRISAAESAFFPTVDVESDTMTSATPATAAKTVADDKEHILLLLSRVQKEHAVDTHVRLPRNDDLETEQISELSLDLAFHEWNRLD